VTKQKNHFIDLFAGCGGFSLGLAQARFFVYGLLE